MIYGRYGRIEVDKLLAKLGVKATAIDLIKHIALISREEVLQNWQSKHDIVYNNVDVIIDNIRYSSIAQIENKFGQILPCNLILNRIFDPKMSSVQAVLHEYLTVTRHGKVHDDKNLFTLSEALAYYSIPEYIVSELHEYTGLPHREIIYLMIYFRPKVEEFYNESVRKSKVEVLEKVKPVSVAQPTGVEVIDSSETTEFKRVTPLSNPNGSSQSNQSGVIKKSTGGVKSAKGVIPSDEVVKLCRAINIDPLLYELDVRKGLGHEQAIARQTARVGSRKTNNAMTINGVHYNSQREVCQMFELNETEVTYYKSRVGCTAYEAVMHFIDQTYGVGVFR